MNLDYLYKIFNDALEKLNYLDKVVLFFEKPKNPEFGDYSTNIAMQLAKTLKMNPRQIAQQIITNIGKNTKNIDSLDMAGGGFINIKLNNNFYFDELRQAIDKGDAYGRMNDGNGKKVNVEYVSVNPTGLLHLGHGRNAALGDTIANLYDWLGYDVTREYYFNNAGNQMNNLAKSIYSRYMQLSGKPDYPFPEDGYHGDYVINIARELKELRKDDLVSRTEDDLVACRKFGEQWCFQKINQTLERLNIYQDVFYNEDSLYSEGKIKALIDELKEKELAYEKDGALWLALTKLGLNDDRVIVKSTGEPTYRLPDIAYHREKFRRGFDLLIDIFGADHIATVPDVLAGVKALGFDDKKVKVIIHQFVTLTENGEQVKMSKRTGKNYTLDDLLDEVGADVVRFFLLMRQVSTHLEFDLSLAREQSEKNPVFYLQYAHARICSILDFAQSKNISLRKEFDPTLLVHPKEIDLIKIILDFEDAIRTAAEKFEPQILADYLRVMAAAFHIFYHECRIVGSEEHLQNSRLWLANLSKIAIYNGLSILGINAPERM